MKKAFSILLCAVLLLSGCANKKADNTSPSSVTDIVTQNIPDTSVSSDTAEDTADTEKAPEGTETETETDTETDTETETDTDTETETETEFTPPVITGPTEVGDPGDDEPIAPAPKPEKVDIPAEPRRTSGQLAFYSVNGTNPYGTCSDDYNGSGPTLAKKTVGGLGGTGAIGLLTASGGYLVIPGKAWIGTDGFTLPRTGGPVVITGKDPTSGTNYLGTIETADGSNGTQTGMFMIKDNGTLNFAGDYIFEDTVILHRAPSSSMQFNIVSGGKVVIGSSVRFDRMTISAKAPIENTRINIEDGAYLYLHAAGFSAYTGKGVIVVDRALVDSGRIDEDVFASFGGKVVDENGYLLFTGSASPLKDKCPQNAALGHDHDCVLDTTTDGVWSLTSFSSELHPGVVLKYKVYIPKNFDPDKQYPFFMYLHGAGGAYMDIATEFSIHSAMRNFIKETNGEAVVIMPQCPILEDSDWPFSATAREVLMELIEHLRTHVSIDRQRIYISGHSFGALGTLTLLAEHPGYFAAAFITSYGTSFSAEECRNIVKTPIRMYCGLKDEYGFANPMKRMAQTLKNTYGGDVEFTMYDDLGHGGVYTRAGNDLDFIRWILAQRA